MAHITQQHLGPNDINTTKNVLLISITGDLDQASIEEDADSIQHIVDSTKAGTIILFDFTNLLYINSRSISYLVNWYMALEQAGAKLVLYGLRPNIIDILDTTGINHVIPIFTHFHEVKDAIEKGQIVTGVSQTTLDPVNLSVPEKVNPNHMEINRVETATPFHKESEKETPKQEEALATPNGPLSISRNTENTPEPTTSEAPSKANDLPLENQDLSINRDTQKEPSTSVLEGKSEQVPPQATPSPPEPAPHTGNEPVLNINDTPKQNPPVSDTEEPEKTSFSLLED